ELAPDTWVTDVARIGSDVVDDLALPVGADPARDATVACDARRRVDRRPRAGNRPRDELVGLLVVEQDRERRTWDGALEHHEGAIEELLEVQDCVELGGEL